MIRSREWVTLADIQSPEIPVCLPLHRASPVLSATSLPRLYLLPCGKPLPHQAHPFLCVLPIRRFPCCPWLGSQFPSLLSAASQRSMSPHLLGGDKINPLLETSWGPLHPRATLLFLLQEQILRLFQVSPGYCYPPPPPPRLFSWYRVSYVSLSLISHPKGNSIEGLFVKWSGEGIFFLVVASSLDFEWGG